MVNKKKIIIKEVIKNKLRSYSDMDGEWNTDCDIDFILSEPCTFKLFDEKITIDRVKMYVQYWETQLSFANESKVYECFTVPKNFINSIYKKVLYEQKYGFMKTYSFEEDFLNMLQS